MNTIDNVRDAGKVQPTDQSRLYLRHILPHRKKWPTLPKGTQDDIRMFLEAYSIDCKEAHDATERLMAINPSHPGLSAQLTYWENVSAGIRWMLSRLPQKQRYLALLMDESKPVGEM